MSVVVVTSSRLRFLLGSGIFRCVWNIAECGYKISSCVSVRPKNEMGRACGAYGGGERGAQGSGGET